MIGTALECAFNTRFSALNRKATEKVLGLILPGQAMRFVARTELRSAISTAPWRSIFVTFIDTVGTGFIGRIIFTANGHANRQNRQDRNQAMPGAPFHALPPQSHAQQLSHEPASILAYNLLFFKRKHKKRAYERSE